MLIFAPLLSLLFVLFFSFKDTVSDDLMGDGCLGKPELTHAFAAVLAAAKVLGHGQPMTHPRETALHLATELIRSGGRGAKLSKAEFIPLYREMVAGG